jgi:hypothetical protein
MNQCPDSSKNYLSPLEHRNYQRRRIQSPPFYLALVPRRKDIHKKKPLTRRKGLRSHQDSKGKLGKYPGRLPFARQQPVIEEVYETIAA